MYRKITLSLLLLCSVLCAAARQPRHNAKRCAGKGFTDRQQRTCGPDTLHVAQFGMKADSGEDAAEALQRALAACREQGAHVLLFDKGVYNIGTEDSPRRRRFISNSTSETEYDSKEHIIALLIENFDGLTIEGNGAMLMLHGKLTPVMMIDSRNIRINNLGIDFERPTMSEMKVLSSGNGETTVEFHPDSRYVIEEGHLSLVGDDWVTTYPHCIDFNPATERCAYSNGWQVLSSSRARELSPRIVSFFTPNDFSLPEGHILTVRDIIRNRLGIVIDGCSDITLDGCNIRYMPGPGIICQNTRNLTMLNMCCAPDPKSGRIMASSADFMHFSGCSGRITVADCRFEGAHDDGINVHGTHLKVTERLADNSVQLRFMHHQTYGIDAFSAGDTVAVVKSSTLVREFYAVVTDVERTSDRTLTLTLDRTLPQDIADGFCIENMTRTPEVEIRRCSFTHTNTRGTLITTPRKVVIADCIYLRTGMSAILIADDADSWFESGGVCDVTIEGNTFIDCGYGNGTPHSAVIAICPSVAIPDPERPAHSNIRIENNRFVTFGNTVLYALSTQGLAFRNNTTEVASRAAGYDNTEPIVLEACTDTDISGNIFSEQSEDKK